MNLLSIIVSINYNDDDGEEGRTDGPGGSEEGEDKRISIRPSIHYDTIVNYELWKMKGGRTISEVSKSIRGAILEI